MTESRILDVIARWRDMAISLAVDDPWCRSTEGLDDGCHFCESTADDWGTPPGSRGTIAAQPRHLHADDCPWMTAREALCLPTDGHFRERDKPADWCWRHRRPEADHFLADFQKVLADYASRHPAVLVELFTLRVPFHTYQMIVRDMAAQGLPTTSESIDRYVTDKVGNGHGRVHVALFDDEVVSGEPPPDAVLVRHNLAAPPNFWVPPHR